MKKTETVLVGVESFFDQGVHVSLGQAVEAFLRVERANAGWSKETEKWYRDRLQMLLNDLGSERALVELMEADLAGWHVRLSERDSRFGESRPEISGGLSPYTLHGHIRAVKRFCGWLLKAGVLTVDLARDVKLPRLPKQLRKGISDEDALAILDAARSHVRDYAIITFIESTGVRRGGTENLRLSDLRLDSGSKRLRFRAIVREKGEKERPVVMSQEAHTALAAWLAERPVIPACPTCREKRTDCEHVFLGCSPGQAWHRLTDVGISEIFDRYKHSLGLAGPCSPHQWRHRWCRRMLENGMPLGHVSQLAGHSDIKVTHDFYGGFSIDQLQDSYSRFYRKPTEEEE